jgi:hypothetical protein
MRILAVGLLAGAFAVKSGFKIFYDPGVLIKRN